MTFDNEGRFRPQNFEDIFAKYDEGHKGGLDISDLLRFWKGQRLLFDFFGWSASFLECKCFRGLWIEDVIDVGTGLATYLLLWPEDGIMRKDDIRWFYDGSIFYRKAEEYGQKKKKQQQDQRKGTSPRLISLADKVF